MKYVRFAGESMSQQYIPLNNGVKMPQLGLGVWQARDGEEVEAAVSTALEAGYRLIDTAAVYGNERGVGRAIAASNIPRKEIFATTKLWNADQGYMPALAAFEKSLARLNLDYIDLYLIHWPVPAADKYIETWRALEKLYSDGRVRAIGVSNFKPAHLERLIAESTVVPAVNQIELHPYLSQTATREFCARHGIAVESWSPLGGSNGPVLDDETIKAIAAAHDKSPAQVIIRWHIQHGLITIPKSVHKNRIDENFDVWDFELSDKDMQAIDSLNTDTRVGPDPDNANFT